MLEIGTIVGGYTVLEPLGAGGFGAVFRVGNLAGQTFALKIAGSGVPAAPPLLSQQQNEVDALIRLSHPSIIGLHDCGYQEGIGYFLVMPLAEGQTLERYLLRSHRLPILETLLMIQEIAEALAHCHSRGILHLDLKPENIMVVDTLKPRLRILDFGLAQWLRTGVPDCSAEVRGSFAYLPPENIEGNTASVPGPEDDLYALGVIWYQLLTGGLPFHGKSSSELLTAKKQMMIQPLQSLVPGLPEMQAALILQLLNPNRAQRLSHAAWLGSRLKQQYFETLDHRRTVGVLPLHASIPTAALPPSFPFIGREHELRSLGQKLRVEADQPLRCLLILGEAGIGKSRLLFEALQPLRSNRQLIAYSRCRQIGALVPYSSLRELLSSLALQLGTLLLEGGDSMRRAVAESLAAEASILCTLAPEFSAWLPMHDMLDGPIVRERGHLRIVQCLRLLLRAVAREVCVTLVVEDLHWADIGTMAVLAALAEDPTSNGVCCVYSSRSKPTQLSDTFVESLMIGPLKPQDNVALLAALTRSSSSEELAQLMDTIPLLRLGHPMCTTQLLGSLEADGLLWYNASGMLQLSPRLKTDYRPPATVMEALLRTVDRLECTSGTILGAAAILGRRIVRSELAALNLFGDTDLDNALETCARLNLIVRSASEHFFAHDAIQECALDRLDSAQRSLIHAKIALTLGEQTLGAGARAFHLEAAGDVLRAAAAYHRAAQEAIQLLDPHGAFKHLEKAFHLYLRANKTIEEPHVMSDVAQAATLLAVLSGPLGKTDQAMELLNRSRRLLPTEHLMSQAAFESALARVHQLRGDYQIAIQASRKALEISAHIPDLRRFEAAPLCILGRALSGSNRFAEALPVLEAACERARETESYGDLCQAQGMYALALSFTGQHRLAWKFAHEGAENAARLSDPLQTIASLFYRAAIADGAFEPELLVTYSVELLAFAAERRLEGTYLITGTVTAGRGQLQLGQLEQAHVLLSNAVELSRKLGIHICLGLALTSLADILFIQGQVQAAFYRYQQAQSQAQLTLQEEGARGISLAGIAHCKALMGEPLASVCDNFEQALALLKTHGNLSWSIHVHQRYAEALEARGASEAAARLWQERSNLVSELRLGSVDWWPAVPSGLQADSDSRSQTLSRIPSKRREMWKALATGSRRNGKITL